MKNIVIPILAVIIFNSCSTVECPENEVLKNNEVDSKPYRAELVKQLNQLDLGKLSYYIADYSEDSDRQYLLVSMQSDELCAFVKMDITDCRRFNHLKALKGMSYINAGLYDLTYTLDDDFNFTLENIGGIID